MTKTTPDAYVKLPIPRRQLNATWSESLTSRRMLLWALLLSTSALGGCATYIPPEISYDTEVPPLPAPPASLDDRLQPLHVPPLWKPALGGKSGGKEDAEPVSRVETANSAARVEPRKRGYFNAAQIYAYSPGRALPGLRRARPDHGYCARRGRTVDGIRTNRGRRHSALGCGRYREREW